MYPLPVPASARDPPAAATARRLVSICLALQLRGAPAPDAARRLLLVRYVTGRTTLQAILPALEAPLGT